MAVRKAIFLDKDGTLIPDIPYNVDVEKITLSSSIISGLKALNDAGYAFIMISNQSGIAKGYFDQKAIQAVEAKVRQLLVREGIYLDGFYYCPHDEHGEVAAFSRPCKCRKPQPGLIIEAAHDHDIDLANSWMIGDILDDIESGHRAGCKAILINNGNETIWEMNELRVPDVMLNSINEAAVYILNDNISNYQDDERVSAANRAV